MHALDVAEEKETYTYTKREQKCGHINIAEALISKGLAHCLRHRQNDDQRSSRFDDLLAAEARAVKNAKVYTTRKTIPFITWPTFQVRQQKYNTYSTSM